MEVLILGVYLEIFLFRIKWSKIRVRIIHGRALYTGKYGIGSLNCVFNLPGSQVKFFLGNLDYRRTVINPIHKKNNNWGRQNGFQASACLVQLA